jgi:hypothetical protein
MEQIGMATLPPLEFTADHSRLSLEARAKRDKDA